MMNNSLKDKNFENILLINNKNNNKINNDYNIKYNNDNKINNDNNNKFNDDNNNDNVLFLNEKPYKNISGPISFYILKPKVNMSKYKLPLIILFGDEHFSDNYQCTTNKNNLNLIENFLNNIEDVSVRYKYKIDFFMELGTNLKNEDNNKEINNKELIPNLREKIINCYIKKTKHKCYYKNIRFHMTDVRYISTIKNDMIINSNIYNHFTIMLSNIINNINDRQITEYIINYFNNYKLVNIFYLDILIDICNENFNFDNLIIKYKKIIDDNYFINKQKTKNNSNIADQIIHNFIKNNINYFYNNYYTSSIKPYLNIFENLKNLINNDNYENYNKLNIINLKSIINDNYNNFINNIDQLIMLINRIFLDIYYTLRTFKRIKDKTLISIGIFGNAHIKRIVDVLTSIQYYNIIFQKQNFYSKDKNFRCINIDQYINLDYMIYSHINEYYLKKYKKYYLKLYNKEVNSDINQIQINYKNYIKYKKEYYDKKQK